MVSRSRPCAAGEQRLEQRLEVLRHVGEGAGEHVDDLGVDGPDDLGEVAAGRLHVVELLLEERVALLERVVLLERERVDRPHEPQLALELARPGRRRDALGQLGRLGGHGRLGLELEVAAQRLDGRLEAQLHLGLVELGAARLLARLLEAALGVLALAAQLVEADGGGALRLALAAAALAQLPELGLDDGEPVGDQRGQAVDGGLLGVELDAAHLGLAPRLDGALEARLDLDAPVARNWRRSARPAERTSRSARSEPTAAARSSRCSLASAIARARSAVSASSASRSGSVRSSSATRACSRARRSPSSAACDRSASASVPASRRSASTRWRPSVAAVSCPSCSSSWRATAASAWRASSSSERAPCRLASAWDAAVVAVCARSRASSSAAPVAPLDAVTGAPAGGAEAAAVPRDDDGVGVRQRHVDRRRPAAVDGDGTAEERVEQRARRRVGRSARAHAPACRSAAPVAACGWRPARAPRHRRRPRHRRAAPRRRDERRRRHRRRRRPAPRRPRPRPRPPSRDRSRPGRAACRPRRRRRPAARHRRACARRRGRGSAPPLGPSTRGDRRRRCAGPPRRRRPAARRRLVAAPRPPGARRGGPRLPRPPPPRPAGARPRRRAGPASPRASRGARWPARAPARRARRPSAARPARRGPRRRGR